MAKKKKHILSFEPEVDFEMIGLCSHHSDYRLAWSINNKLGLKLIKSKEDYQLTNKKGEITSSHSSYEYEDEQNRLNYYLVKNKSQGRFLVHEKPSIDFFLFLCENNAIEIETLIEKLKVVPSILGAYQFDPEDIASTEDLVFN